MAKKDFVLGAAVNYSFDQVRNFIVSLKETDFHGDVGILLSHEQSDLAVALRALGVRIFYFEGAPLYRVKPNQSRFIKKLEILLEERDKYERVFLSDVRDVVFQKNPFDYKSEKSLSAVLEEGSVTIGESKVNSRWVKALFGSKVLKEIGGNKISCCGTVLGSVDGMITYLQKMLAIAGSGNKMAMRRLGIDQGIHNFMIYKGILDDFDLLENNTLVKTISFIPPAELLVNDDDIVVNLDGSVSAVVHQYDRSAELTNRLNEKFQKIYAGKYRQDLPSYTEA